MKKQVPLFTLLISLLFVSCNSARQSQPAEVQKTVTYPVGYIAQYLSTDLYDTTELYPLQEAFLEDFMQIHTQYEGTHPVMAAEFPKEWGVALVERLPEGRELYQIQSQNREWIYLVITSGYGTQRILDLLPVAVNLANQSQELLETEIWTTDREIDGTFAVTKKYEWKRSLEKVTQQEYDANPNDYFRTQTVTDKYFINDFYRFERIITEDIPNYSVVVFYYRDEKPEDYEDVVPMLQAFCEDYSLLFTDANEKFDQLELYDYKLNYITTLDITPNMELEEGFIFMKKGETPKTVPFGSYERLKIEVKRYFKIVTNDTDSSSL
jgi:hypothetical protein